MSRRDRNEYAPFTYASDRATARHNATMLQIKRRKQQNRARYGLTHDDIIVRLAAVAAIVATVTLAARFV